MSGIIREERIGGQRLILGDCLDVMPLLGKVDAVVTDVPYGISKVSNGLRRIDYGDWDEANVADDVAFKAMRNAPAHNHILIWCADRQVGRFFDELGGYQRRILTWSKPNPTVLNGQHNFLPATEFAAHGKKDGAWFGGNCERSEWRGIAPRERQHPTEKPLGLMIWCVENICPEGGLVLDPFMGSGTTLVACQRLGRQGIGIEIDPNYFEIACKRVDDAARQPDLFVETQEPAHVQEGFDL